MNEFEVIWIREFPIEDLGLKGKKGQKAYISEEDAKISKDFKKARRVGAIDAKPIRRHLLKERQDGVFDNPVTPTSNTLDYIQIQRAFSKALEPILETQKSIICLLESLVDKGFSVSSYSGIEEKNLVRSSIEKEPDFDISPEITFHDVKLENEIQRDSTDNKNIQDTLGKLSAYRKRKKKE